MLIAAYDIVFLFCSCLRLPGVLQILLLENLKKQELCCLLYHYLLLILGVQWLKHFLLVFLVDFFFLLSKYRAFLMYDACIPLYI